MENIQSSGSSDAGSDSTTPPARGKQINASLYQLYVPANGNYEVDVIFFHGLQAGYSYEDAYLKTWCNKNGEIWPREFLKKNFPKCRVLSVSYESSALRRVNAEGTDMFKITENLVQDIVLSDDANVGRGNTRVILVGHSLGGFVIKKVLLEAEKKRKETAKMKPSDQSIIYNILYKNLVGVYYYSTPHGGAQLANYFKKAPLTTPLLGFLEILGKDAGILNNNFHLWRTREGRPHRIPTSTINESLPTKGGSLLQYLPGFDIVIEASGRIDSDDYYTASEDHFSICKPESPKQPTYYHLKNFMKKNLPEAFYVRAEDD